MKRLRLASLFVPMAVTVLAFRSFAQPDKAPVSSRPAPAVAGNDGKIAYTTPNTMRLAGSNVYEAATAITQATYGATHHEDRPHAITLVRADRQADTMLAASRVTHFPANSPVPYVDADRLPPETYAEVRRLGPDGNAYYSGVPVYLHGPMVLVRAEGASEGAARYLQMM